jgi:shikimate kinase
MNDKQNIIIIGMPGCGKSTFGKALARSHWDVLFMMQTTLLSGRKEKRFLNSLPSVKTASAMQRYGPAAS